MGSGPPELFSDAWFDELDHRLEASGAGSPSAGPSPRLALGIVVTGLPGRGEVRYQLGLGGGRPPELTRATTEGATVTLVQDLATAEALADGSVSMSDLLTAGRIKVRGDARALVAAGDQLAALAAALRAEG